MLDIFTSQLSILTIKIRCTYEQKKQPLTRQDQLHRLTKNSCASPLFKDVLGAIDFAIAKDYPARGEYTGAV